MICPFCLHKKSEVYNSRTTKEGTVVWRRRRCKNCGKAFTSEEMVDPSGIWSVKNDKKIVPYSRAKLVMSILRACDHRVNQDRSVWYLYQTIERRLFPVTSKGHVLTSKEISSEVCTVLKRFDPTAYIKYLSYHQPSMDARTLRKRLRKE